MIRPVLLSALATAVAHAGSATSAPAPVAPTLEAVQAILTARCTSCHGATKPKGKLNLTDLAQVAKQVAKSNPDKSKLYTLIVLPDTSDERMPPAGGKHARVPDAEAETIRDWIAAGAAGLP